jgi:menaquinol-cytochrome c reductase iron-sulfur subunit
MSHLPPSPTTGEINPMPRRSFLSKALATLIGGILGLIPTIPAVMYFLDPLTRKKRAVGILGADPEGYFKITSVEALSPDGAPRLFSVVADLRNFWNKFPDTEVGAVYLRKDPETGDVSCFNARCPHLGCTVKYEDASKTYVCPCHSSAFSLDGKRTNDIPPRDMDTLKPKVEPDGSVKVKYEKYRAGIHEKVPI